MNSTQTSRRNWLWRACSTLVLLLAVAVVYVRTAWWNEPERIGSWPSKIDLRKGSSLELPWLINSTSGPFVRPLWICGAPKPSEKKLVFVHVLKTAGTTLRAFFDEYAKECGVGWTEMQCSAPNVSSVGIGRGEWRSRSARNPCVMKKYVLRSGESKRHTQPIENEFVEGNADIMGGHIPLGTGNVWAKVKEKTRDEWLQNVQYIAFFRNAATKYVSGEAFWKPKKKLSELVEETKAKVQKEASSGQYHKKYGIYLTTPSQREEIESRAQRPSTEDHTLMIMANLIRHDVAVGITERLPQSMELLQQLINSSGNATDIFVRYGMAGGDAKLGSTTSSMKVNPSKISSSTVMKELKKDDQFMTQLLECVKYEQQISDFALALHLRQHSNLGVNIH